MTAPRKRRSVSHSQEILCYAVQYAENPFLCVTNKLDSEIKRFNWRAYSFIYALIFTLYGVNDQNWVDPQTALWLIMRLCHHLKLVALWISKLQPSALSWLSGNLFKPIWARGLQRGKLHVREVFSSCLMCVWQTAWVTMVWVYSSVAMISVLWWVNSEYVHPSWSALSPWDLIQSAVSVSSFPAELVAPLISPVCRIREIKWVQSPVGWKWDRQWLLAQVTQKNKVNL